MLTAIVAIAPTAILWTFLLLMLIQPTRGGQHQNLAATHSILETKGPIMPTSCQQLSDCANGHCCNSTNGRPVDFFVVDAVPT
jgi:hypothetical protein